MKRKRYRFLSLHFSLKKVRNFVWQFLFGRKSFYWGDFTAMCSTLAKKFLLLFPLPESLWIVFGNAFVFVFWGKFFLILVNRPVVACHCNLCFCSAQGSRGVRDCIPFPSNFFNIKGKTFTENLFCTSEVLLQNMEWNLCKQMLPIVGGYS